MASWAHPGNWICARAGTGPSIDRSLPHHTDAAARPPAARGRRARGLRRGGAVTVASFFGMQEGSARLHDRADLQERVAEWWALLRPALAPAVVRQFFPPARGV